MRSKFEKLVASLFRKAKVTFKYEPYKVPYTITCNYIPDFVIGDILVETKGFFKPEDRKKLLAVKKDNPNLDIRIWFQQDNYLTKAKKSRYSDWARKNNFPYHVGDKFPKHWFKKS